MTDFSFIQEITISILPVFFFLLLGWLFRRTNLFSHEQISGFKKLVVNFTLPSLLFLAFFSMPLNRLSLLLSGVIFVFSFLALGYGLILAPRLLPGSKTGAFVFSGYEAGMLGYGLFLGFFGQEHLGLFALIDLGQVLFVFLVLVPLVKRSSGVQGGLRDHLQTIIKTPVVWAIFLGLLAGGLNRVIPFQESFGLVALSRILNILGGATVPLISISVGFDLSVEQNALRKSFLVIATRLACMIGMALVITELVLPHLLDLGIQMSTQDLRLLRAGIWILFLLPPPFVIPAFLPTEASNEAGQISSILSLHTLVSVLAIPLVLLMLG